MYPLCWTLLCYVCTWTSLSVWFVCARESMFGGKSTISFGQMKKKINRLSILFRYVFASHIFSTSLSSFCCCFVVVVLFGALVCVPHREKMGWQISPMTCECKPMMCLSSHCMECPFFSQMSMGPMVPHYRSICQFSSFLTNTTENESQRKKEEELSLCEPSFSMNFL